MPLKSARPSNKCNHETPPPPADPHRLLRRGVIVRPVGGGYQLPEHLRVTIGTSQENEKFLAALAASLKE